MLSVLQKYSHVKVNTLRETSKYTSNKFDKHACVSNKIKVKPQNHSKSTLVHNIY